MADINLSHAVRSNLLSLQSTAANMAKTQERLATGLKVNSALDNPTNFFTASALNSRAGDMANLLDSMSNGIKTIEAADNGIKSIVKTVETMQSTLRQARQDKSFKSESYSIALGGSPAGTEDIEFTGGAVGTTAVKVGLTDSKAVLTAASNYANLDFDQAGDNVTFNIAQNGGSAIAVKIEQGTNAESLKITVGSTVVDNIATVDRTAVTGAEMATALTTAFDAANLSIDVAGATGSKLTFTSETATDPATSSIAITGAAVANGGGGTPLALADFGFAAAGALTQTGHEAKTVDEIVSAISATAALTDKVRATNDNGRLRLENLSTTELTVTGVTSGGIASGGATSDTIGRNDVRRNLVTQFNELRDQLDKFADDASFNGINLLRGDKLKLTFNETGSSTIEIQAKDEAGVATAINNTSLGIDLVVESDFDADATLDTKLSELKDALDFMRSQSSSFGSNLSIVQNRTDFTKNMINTLETGAANLTLADTNEEAANLLALQTRQQLSSTALSMASQADQAVLRLF
jgi:flagellin